MAASVSAQPVHSWGMSGSHACYIDEATVVLACGNGIIVWPPNTNRQSTVHDLCQWDVFRAVAPALRKAKPCVGGRQLACRKATNVRVLVCN